MADLDGESLILFDRESSYFALVMNIFRDLGIVPYQQMYMDNIEASKKMVEQNLGIAMLPAVSVEREIKLGTLHKVHLNTPEPVERDIAIMYRRNKPQSGLMSSFLSLIGQIYEVQLPG